MGVVDGQPVSAAVTNPAFLDANADDTALGRLTLNDTVGNPTESGPSIANIQREHNSIASFVGKAINAAKDALPSWLSNVVGASTDTIKQRADALTVQFDSTLGHSHDGSAGGGAPISAPNLSNVPLRGFFLQGANLTGVSGGSDDVTTELTGKTPSTGVAVEGVVVTVPYNRAVLRDTNGQEFLDGSGNEVYGRVTESAGTWTLTFFVDIAGVETPYSFPAPVTVVWYYQELFNPMVNPPVYDPGAFIPSDAATADVVDASATQRGLVSTGTQTMAGEKTFQDGLNVGVKLNPSFLTSNSLVTKIAAGLSQLLVGKGEIVTSTGSGAPTTLPVGTDGQVLSADSTQPTGLRWISVVTDYANRTLSNLTSPVAVNQDLNPDTDQARNFGSNSLAWLVTKAIRYGAKNTVVSVTGDVTSGSATITNIADTSQITTAQSVFGPGIPSGATVASKTATSVTFSHPAGLTASSTTIGATVQFPYMLIARAEDQTSTTAAGAALVRAASGVDADGGPLISLSGRATGTGNSGDSFVGSGTVSSGTQGLLWLFGRYVRIPTRSTDPSDFRAGGLYWNTTSSRFRQADGTAWADLSGGGGLSAASQAEMEAATSITTAVTPGRAQYHPGAAKAWVQWVSSTVLASYNVSSVTDNGNADQTINFSTPFSSASYSMAGMSGLNTTSMRVVCQQYNAFGPATGSCRLQIIQSDGLLSNAVRGQAVFYGDQ